MTEMTEMGNQLHHKAMSRSLRCAVLLELLNMKEQLPVDVTMAFTVQRHVGNRGAYSAAAALDGGIAISLDLCPGDTVGDDLPHLGKGPVVPSMDQKAIFDPELTEKLAAAARACGIPIQRWAKAECDGDGGVFQRSGNGFSAAALYCPGNILRSPRCWRIASIIPPLKLCLCVSLTAPVQARAPAHASRLPTSGRAPASRPRSPAQAGAARRCSGSHTSPCGPPLSLTPWWTSAV